MHAVQRWRTPYVSDTYAASRPAGTGPLTRIGNADLVRGISDCLALAHSAAETSPTAAVYGQLVADCTRATDRYHWLADPELGVLADPLTDLRDTAQQVLTEFETVQELTRQATDALAKSADRITALVRRIRGEAPALPPPGSLSSPNCAARTAAWPRSPRCRTRTPTGSPRSPPPPPPTSARPPSARSRI